MNAAQVHPCRQGTGRPGPQNHAPHKATRRQNNMVRIRRQAVWACANVQFKIGVLDVDLEVARTVTQEHAADACGVTPPFV